MADQISWLGRLHAPKAFGEEVTGSTPVFSTSFKGLQQCGLFSLYVNNGHGVLTILAT